jgi:hypothetical protein
MGRYSPGITDVSSDERVSPTHLLHTTVRLVRSHCVLHVDSQGEELSTDDHQCSSDDPMHRRATASFWLTRSSNDHILTT